MPDILNAGWCARQERISQAREAGTSPVEALATVDSLVAKALEDLHFSRTWVDAGGRIGHMPSTPPAEGASDQVDAVALSREDLHARLARGASICDAELNGAIVCSPLFPDSLTGVSMNLHLGPRFIAFRKSGTTAFRPLDLTQDPRLMQELVEKDWDGHFVLHPGELVLAATLEYLALPGDLSAQVITRSSYGRLGLLTATAVQVQPLFRGCLTLELVNLGQLPLELTPGEAIAQLVFQPVDPPIAEEAGLTKYRYPTGPQFSKVKDDADLKILQKIATRSRRQRSR
jgi:deoxycytidine triphosphate deaminase